MARGCSWCLVGASQGWDRIERHWSEGRMKVQVGWRGEEVSEAGSAAVTNAMS